MASAAPGRPAIWWLGEPCPPAGSVAPAAGLSTQPAVLVHASVTLTFGGAAAAGNPAGFQDCPGDVRVVTGVPGQHGTGGCADIGAVEIGPDAFGQLCHHVLAKAGVRASGTGF